MGHRRSSRINGIDMVVRRHVSEAIAYHVHNRREKELGRLSPQTSFPETPGSGSSLMHHSNPTSPTASGTTEHAIHHQPVCFYPHRPAVCSPPSQSSTYYTSVQLRQHQHTSNLYLGALALETIGSLQHSPPSPCPHRSSHVPSKSMAAYTRLPPSFLIASISADTLLRTLQVVEVACLVLMCILSI